jgi:hypothetical protein
MLVDRRDRRYVHLFCLICLLYKNGKMKIYKTIILPLVVYRCGNMSLTLREERRLTVFESRALRETF